MPRFALFAAQTPAATGLVARHPSLVDASIRAPLGEGGIWLVRPDGCVACSATDPAVIDRYLDKLTSAAS
jgi:hypothetical protein